jgi:hypothetical protein
VGRHHDQIDCVPIGEPGDDLGGIAYFNGPFDGQTSKIVCEALAEVAFHTLSDLF